MDINILKKRIREDNNVVLTITIFVLIILIITFYCVYSYKNKILHTELKKISSKYKATSILNSTQNVYQTNIKGIICWGSDLTAGNREKGISYPKLLEDKLNNEGYKIPVKNMGVSGESTKTLMARSGALKMLLQPFTIPEEPQKVYVSFRGEDGSWVFPLVEGDAGITNVTIAGVNGKLFLDKSQVGNNIYSYYFIRDNRGERINVPNKSNIVTNGSYEWRDYLPIICIGDEYDKANTQKLINNQQAILKNYSSEEFYILGTIDGREQDYTKLDIAMKDKWGEHYINLRQYLMDKTFANKIGIKFTNEDNSDIKNGYVPSVYFKNNVLTDEGYKAISQIIYDNIVQNIN